MVDDEPSRDTREIVRDFLQSLAPADRYIFLAKLHGVPVKVIQQALARAPYNTRMAVGAVEAHFNRLRQRLKQHLERP